MISTKINNYNNKSYVDKYDIDIEKLILEAINKN